MIPPKPAARPHRVGPLRYLRLLRRDVLSAQSDRLYRAKMADYRVPGLLRSVLVNDPPLVDEVLRRRPMDFPKSARVGRGLRPLLGRSVFLTNGSEWERQRRIIDPAFEGGRLRDAFPGMVAAARAGAGRLSEGEVEIEEAASHAAADVIFRTLFSVPIEDADARATFQALQAYQRSGAVMRARHWLPLPGWILPPSPRPVRAAGAAVRLLIERMVARRAAEIEAKVAPDDLATKIMTQPDPETGERFGPAEMVDQVAIFFLAGHETSAAALSWALWCLAAAPDWQDRAAAEAAAWPEVPGFGDLSKLQVIRDVFRETLRLYPPVPMMMRTTTAPETFRGRRLRAGTQVVLSPWHLGRHEALWDRPDTFDPGRWGAAGAREAARHGFLPFSAGPRVCTGAGFAMAEGAVLLAEMLRAWRFETAGEVPMPVAHLTVRSANGIRLRLSRRQGDARMRPEPPP
ncbi:cytochrome P450 [Hasllibacter halocynthiae]|uniref:Cytochrome P450 n=1 Tax=Hasllibacter halocynthiae TaxID=595589 RepID=A0A2T0X7R8_9RHOB|nr:cytochrome P450 [Hasllibacter halocynthiae]PRY94992.1 cytochrome P450 [Hasllibacter halocynthiae]